MIFRGYFNASGEETAIDLTVQGGFAFGYSAFLNGVFLGSNQGNATVSLTTDSLPIPAGSLRVAQDNVLTVIQGEFNRIAELYFTDSKYVRPYGVRNYCDSFNILMLT